MVFFTLLIQQTLTIYQSGIINLQLFRSDSTGWVILVVVNPCNYGVLHFYSFHRGLGENFSFSPFSFWVISNGGVSGIQIYQNLENNHHDVGGIVFVYSQSVVNSETHMHMGPLWGGPMHSLHMGPPHICNIKQRCNVTPSIPSRGGLWIFVIPELCVFAPYAESLRNLHRLLLLQLRELHKIYSSFIADELSCSFSVWDLMPINSFRNTHRVLLF